VQRLDAVLSKPERQALYHRRQQIVEPVTRTKHWSNRPLPPPRPRRTQAGWHLIAATNDLLKLWFAGNAYAHAKTAEPLAA
jgi:hypothetical protein